MICASLWLGKNLSFIEKLCIQSFLNAGHRYVLYTDLSYEDMALDVEIRSPLDIVDEIPAEFGAENISHAQFSDYFRYRMLHQTEYVWVDTDVMCLKAYPYSEYFLGKYHIDQVNNCVLRLPKDSETLADLIKATESEHLAAPPAFYTSAEAKERIAHKQEQGLPLHVSDLDHEAWGPFALTHFLRENDEYRFALEKDKLDPLPSSDLRSLLKHPRKFDYDRMRDAYSVHFYGTKLRRIVARHGGVPKPNSVLGRWCSQHGIDPAEAPVS